MMVSEHSSMVPERSLMDLEHNSIVSKRNSMDSERIGRIRSGNDGFGP
jgi:hypothetical protein